MTNTEVKRFLQQFKDAKKRMAVWPKWMRDAAHWRAATFPKGGR